MNGVRAFRWSYLVWGIGAVVLLAAILVAAFSASYSGKIYPGVRLDGVYVGGLSRTAALQHIQNASKQYAQQTLTVHYGASSLSVPVNQLAATYSDAGVTAAMSYGRHGGLLSQYAQRLRSLVGRPTTYANYQYTDANLIPYVDKIDASVARPVANATLTYRNGAVAVTSAQPGQRLERGLLILALEQQLSTMNKGAVRADVYGVAPTIGTADLASAPSQAKTEAAQAITVHAAGSTSTISQATILGWFDVSTPAGKTDLPLDPLTSFYSGVTVPVINLNLNPAKVEAYVGQMADGVNVGAKNATLGWQNNAVVITAPSVTGKAMDQTDAVKKIETAVAHPAASHDLTFQVAAAQAAVNETNYTTLGLTSQLSEGVTYFPGSSADRITNVRVGAQQFNNVLLAPGQQFSFGKILGPVGPEQGYKPGLVILGNHEEKQYGGGLCQVASTAFRAALLAGLPINERYNHSYAVDFYTAPYGVPGVDATIYYPQVDLKFTNDTPNYMLITTSISGTTLKFDYYGTKTKQGVIRGPQFVSGSLDATKPSETIFYRDIQDLSGNVTKTDTFKQYYQSSLNFPIEATAIGG